MCAPPIKSLNGLESQLWFWQDSCHGHQSWMMYTSIWASWRKLTIVNVRPRVAEVVWRQKGASPKSLDLYKNFRHQHTLLCLDIKICRDLRTFWKTMGQKVLFWDNNSVSWAWSALLQGIYCILYFCGHFCPRRKVANFCHPGQTHVMSVHRWLDWLLRHERCGCSFIFNSFPFICMSLLYDRMLKLFSFFYCPQYGHMKLRWVS